MFGYSLRRLAIFIIFMERLPNPNAFNEFPRDIKNSPADNAV